jgi:hypothetical protein
LLSATVIFVMNGSSPPNCSKTPMKTGTRKVTRAMRTMSEKEMTTPG